MVIIAERNIKIHFILQSLPTWNIDMSHSALCVVVRGIINVDCHSHILSFTSFRFCVSISCPIGIFNLANLLIDQWTILGIDGQFQMFAHYFLFYSESFFQWNNIQFERPELVY